MLGIRFFCWVSLRLSRSPSWNGCTVSGVLRAGCRAVVFFLRWSLLWFRFRFLPFFARCDVVFAWFGYLLGFGVFRAVWGYFRLILPLFSLGCLVAFICVAVFSGIIAILSAVLNLRGSSTLER